MKYCRCGALRGALHPTIAASRHRCCQGFPTIKLFTPDGGAPTDYQGPREAKALANAAVGALLNSHGS